MAVTSAFIKAALDTVLAVENIRVYDYPRPDARKVMPYVEIANVQPDGTEADERVKNIAQKFMVTLFIRVRGQGTDEVARQKVLEDIIFNKLDATTLGGTILFVENKIWTRPSKPIVKPVLHYESSLNVLVTDIKSTTGAGILGAEGTLTLPSLADMPLLDKPLEPENETFENVYNAARVRKRAAPIDETHSWLGTVEFTQARIDQLRTLKRARNQISFTHKRKGVSETRTGRLVAISNGAPFANVETITLQLEVLN